MYATTLAFEVLLPEDPIALDLTRLYARFHTLTDQRARRGVRYPLPLLLTIAGLATLSGHSRLRAIAAWAALRAHEFASWFQLERATMPHPVTWSRVFGTAVDLHERAQVLGEVLRPPDLALVPARASIALARAGKTLRGTIPRGQTQGVHVVAAYLPQEGVVVAQLAVQAKEHAIVVAPTVVAHLNLQGMVVTGDAMYTHRTLSTQIVEAGGDYLWLVKDNQPEVRQDSEQLFRPELHELGTTALPTDCTMARTLEQGHGRIEERLLTTSSRLQDDSDWPYLAQVFKVESVVPERTSRHRTIRYGVTSIPATVADAAQLLALVRGHWGIENGLHYRRDVTLDEDQSLVRMGHAPHPLAALNNTVLGLLARHAQQNVPSAQRSFSYHLERALAALRPS